MFDSCTLVSPVSELIFTFGGLLRTNVIYPWESLAHRGGEAWDSTAHCDHTLRTGAMKAQQGRLRWE